MGPPFFAEASSKRVKNKPVEGLGDWLRGVRGGGLGGRIRGVDFPG
jgi:hypothetical protein